MDHRPPRPDQPYAWDDERLSAYLDGELSAPEQAQLEARLVVDPELRQLVDELRAVRQQLEILPEYRLQATFAEQVLRRAEQEMLLSPIARETTSVTIAAATTALPTVPATSVESAATPLPRRSLARRWQRGVIWTAVAAAAVLLLIVTNRPHGPDQNHVARHDDPDTTVTVDHGVAKPSEPQPSETEPDSDKNGPTAAKLSAPPEGMVERQAMDKLQRDANRTAGDPATDAPLAKIEQQSDAQKTLEMQSQSFPFASPNGPAAAAASKPADGLATKPVDPQLARAADHKQSDFAQQSEQSGQAKLSDASDKRKNDETRGKMLLKNQAFGAAPGTQAGTRRKELSADLTTFFASEDFKQLTLPRDDIKRDEAKGSQDEQILVVYLTPRAEPTSDRSFESLLASNSIELAEKTLGQATLQNRPYASAAPAAPDGPAGEPLAKAFSGKAEAGEAKDRKATDLKYTDARGASKSQDAAAEAKQPQDKSVVPESQLSAAYNAPAANELYYLEADESQVQELLRQLRVAPDRFTRLSIAARELPQSDERANLREEQSLALQSSPAIAGRKRSEAAAANAPNGADENGKQQPIAQGQPAQAAPPAPAPVVTQSPAVPAPAAETERAPLAPQTPAAPSIAALPNAPQPSAPMANAAPAATAVAPPAPASDVPTPQAEAFSASPAKSNAGQANETLGDADTRSNRRALAMGQQLQATGDRVIAYRLRGVEGLTGASSTQAMNRGQEPAGAKGESVAAGGGGGGFADTKPGNGPLGAAMEKTEPAKNGYVQESGDAKQQNFKNGIAGQSAKSGSPAPALAEAAPGTDPLQADANEASRMLTRNKETEEQIHEKVPAEAAKKSAAPAPKRVRVLFVIEHEPAK